VSGDRPDRAATTRRDHLLAFAQREFTTLVRTRTYLALSAVFAALVIGLPVVGGVGGYLPLVLDLLTPVEVLVPVVAVAFGTWTILADADHGELDVIRTYPIDRATYVGGVYLGRATGLLLVVVVPLVAVGLLVPVLRAPTTSVVAAHDTVDSPLYFLRFLVLTCGYALVVLALSMAVSAVARSRRQGVVLATLVVLVVLVGLDLLVIAGIGVGLVNPGLLSVFLGLTPPGAFRGLVLATATGGLVRTGPPAATVPVSVVGLLLWSVTALAAARAAAWRPVGRRETG
jgi:ABC-type transport system involved in multi-copper enzyme maturation permease subunit